MVVPNAMGTGATLTEVLAALQLAIRKVRHMLEERSSSWNLRAIYMFASPFGGDQIDIFHVSIRGKRHESVMSIVMKNGSEHRIEIEYENASDQIGRTTPITFDTYQQRQSVTRE